MSRLSAWLLGCSWLALVGAGGGVGRAADLIAFPPDSGVIDVTKPPYDAVPNDGKDDTIAIQRALADHPSGNHVFYFPPGQYDLSNILLTDQAPPDLRNEYACLELKKDKKRNILQGAGRNRTVLRLMDHVPADFDRAVVNFGQRPAQRFRNGLRDLTVSVGVGHPQCDGVQFNASNQGAMVDVLIQSEDPERVGRIGLHLGHTDEIGPCLIQRVTVVGFDVGIRTAFQTASQTFDTITLLGQRKLGWQNGFNGSVFIQGLFSQNSVPALVNLPAAGGDPGQGRVLLVNALLSAGAADTAAIRNHKSLYLRDAVAEGYKVAVTRELANYRGNTALMAIPGRPVEEYWANGAYEGRRGGPAEAFPSPDQMLRLPIQTSPVLPWEPDFAQWAGPHQFADGAPKVGSGHPDDDADDTAALQRAIDSGATTIYLPRGTWNIHGTVELRGKVCRLLGCEARMVGPRAGKGYVRLADGAAPVVIVERLESGNIRYQHASGRVWVLQHLLGGSFETTADKPSDVYWNDVGFGPSRIRRQKLWGRQVNLEGDNEGNPDVPAKLVNEGGQVWILGLKTEDAGTQIATLAGGQTELLGSIHVAGRGKDPQFVVTDAAFSAAMVTNPFPLFARETRGNETRDLAASAADVYTLFEPSAIRDRVVIVDSEDATGVTAVGDWPSRDGFDGGFLGSGTRHDGNADKGQKSLTFTADLPVPGTWAVSCRWTNPVSGFSHAKAVPVTIRHADGTAEVTVDQSQGGGRWHLLGQYRFAGPAAVTLLTAGTQGHVIADAIRFERLP